MVERSVALCYLHMADVVATSFHHSLLALMMRDISSSRLIVDMFPSYCGAMGLPQARNKITRTALDAGAEWVFWVDADMGFDPDTLDRLMASADPVDRPIVGGLAFAQLYETGDMFHPGSVVLPTLYTYVPSIAAFERWSDWPRDEIVKVDATGAACLLVHRSVFEKIADDDDSDCWFTPIPNPNAPGHFGEDMSFCLRVKGNGFEIVVDTAVKTSHHKPRWLTEDLFDAEAAAISNFVVIPTKGRRGLVKDLIFNLLKQGEVERIFVLDNGVNDTLANWLDSVERVERIEMPDANIHEMWNAGLRAVHRVCVRCNIAVLNDDLTIGDRFLSTLAGGLRARWDVGVVGPNYDGRTDDGGVVPVDSICAGRYDGSGGLPGFAFMLRGESCYLFPQDLNWWYGDNDMLLHHLSAGHVAGIVTAATCVHVDGGGQTGDWRSDVMKPLLEQDRKTFEAKWSGVA